MIVTVKTAELKYLPRCGGHVGVPMFGIEDRYHDGVLLHLAAGNCRRASPMQVTGYWRWWYPPRLQVTDFRGFRGDREGSRVALDAISGPALKAAGLPATGADLKAIHEADFPVRASCTGIWRGLAILAVLIAAALFSTRTVWSNPKLLSQRGYDWMIHRRSSAASSGGSQPLSGGSIVMHHSVLRSSGATWYPHPDLRWDPMEDLH